VPKLGGWDVAELAGKATVVEPLDPGQGSEFDVFGAAPQASPLDQFGLAEPVHGLGERAVAAITDRIGCRRRSGR
jgi:hypothetical protein